MLIALLCCNNSKSKKENKIKDKLKNTFYSLVCFIIFNSSS